MGEIRHSLSRKPHRQRQRQIAQHHVIQANFDIASRWDIRVYGQAGVLVSPTTNDVLGDLTTLDHHLKTSAPCELSEWVIGYDSALLLFREPPNEQTVANFLNSVPSANSKLAESTTTHCVEVSYNGPDLAEVATACGLKIDEVIRRHSAPTYRVRFLGFAPGFAYLDGLDPALQLPRRATPRPRMDSGAVAIGGAHAGIYSVPTPGGWNWLGNTDHPLFLPESPNPFTLAPGDSVQFIAKS